MELTLLSSSTKSSQLMGPYGVVSLFPRHRHGCSVATRTGGLKPSSRVKLAPSFVAGGGPPASIDFTNFLTEEKSRIVICTNLDLIFQTSTDRVGTFIQVAFALLSP